MSDGTAAIRGYRLVVPREWRKIPVQRGTDQAVKALLDEAFARHGRDQVAQYRRELEGRLRGMIAQARQNAGVDLYLPFGRAEHNLPASFLISYAEFGKPEAPDPRTVLAEVLAQSPGGESLELDGTPAVRTERLYAADPARDVPYPSRRVEYVLPVPGTADSWLVASFSTFGAGDPDDPTARLLCALFDAIMSTFRWHPARPEGPADPSEAVGAAARPLGTS
ncbi:hypothetical protein [Actinacidiphila rubida]|uniref:Uncharacterized protein n=1 Tax=Actinacidiphila rubida TaxID=310780 RepID=A0A1H8P704_9ACTN|nr:hypothetical protein [Actinacidiphila rubida]SEO37514.1 hypothetical protein SAMN05216267_1024139 [Actinacidiphila rubida]